MLHGLDGECEDLVTFARDRLDEDLVMDLEHNPTGEAALIECLVEAHQCDLEDVGRQTLDSCVHRLALGGLADTEVARVELGQVATPTEQRLGVAAPAGFGYRALHIALHVRERRKILREDRGRLLDPDAEAL